MDIETKGLNFWQSLTPSNTAICHDTKTMLELLAVYQQNDVVHGCVDVNAKGIVAAGLKLFKITKKNSVSKGAKKLSRKQQTKALKRFTKAFGEEDELQQVTDHPLLVALNNPDEDLDLPELLRLTVIDLSIFGISYWMKERSGDRIVNYRSLSPISINPVRAPDGKVSSYQYSNTLADGNVKKVPLEKEDVVVFRWPSPADRHGGGDSPLYSALQKIGLSGKWTEWQNWLLNNRARPDGVFIPKGDSIGPDEAKRQEKRIDDKFKGPGNGRWAIAETAGQYVPLNWAPTDLAPLAFNEELRKAVLFALAIPEAFSNNDGNRANLEGSLEQWARQSLSPLASLLEKTLNKIAAEWEPDLVFCFDSVIPEDEAFELQEEKAETDKWNTALQLGAVEVDEYREHVLGLDPKAEEVKEDPAIPEDSESSEEPKPEADAEKAFDLLGLNQMVAKGDIDRATAINLVSYKLMLDQEQAKQLVTHPTTKTKGCSCGCETKALTPPKVTQGKALAEVIVKQTAKQMNHYLSQCGNSKSLSESIAKMFEDEGTKATDDLPDEFTSLEDWDAEDQWEYRPYLQLEMQTTANGRKDALVRAGADKGSFSVMPAKIKEAVDKASLKFAKSTNDTTRKNINDALASLRQELKDGLIEGDTVREMRKRVEGVFEDISRSRATTIAQTETSRAIHQGQQIAAKASKIVKGFKFLLSEDACPICQEFDGKEIGIDGKFNEDDDYSDSPLPAHVNCRCSMLEIIDLSGEDN